MSGGTRRDREDWVAYGRGPGRPRIGGEPVSAVIPAADLAVLDEFGAARGVRRPDMLREAVAFYVRRRGAPAAAVHVVVGCGGVGDGGLLSRAGLEIEAVFTDDDAADRYASMGDMEVYEVPVGWPGEAGNG